MSEEVVIQLIGGAVVIVTTFLTVKYKDVIMKKKVPETGKRRMEGIFDGYERLIARQDLIITSLQKTIDRLEKELESTRLELDESRRMSVRLKQELLSFKSDYQNLTHNNNGGQE